MTPEERAALVERVARITQNNADSPRLMAEWIVASWERLREACAMGAFIDRKLVRAVPLTAALPDEEGR